MLRLGRASALVIVSAFAMGCGAKSPLSDWDRASGNEAPDPSASPPGAAPVHRDGCIAGLQPGAAAPISGYCSDRAGRATHALPEAPALLHSIPTGSAIGAEPVVDALGRAFFAIDDSSGSSGVVEKSLIAIDPDGSVVGSIDYEGRIGALAIVADGTLRVVETVAANGAVERYLSHVTRDLERTARQRLPDDAGVTFAVTADGSLVFTPTGNEGDGRVVATTSLGAFLWRSEPLAGYADAAAIDHQGRAIVSASRYETAELIALDGDTGALLWRFEAEGYAGPPAVAPDGSIRFPLGSPKLSSQELVALEADGSVRFRTPLPGKAVTVGEPTCVDALGTSFVRTFDMLVAVDETGSVLFSRDVHPNGVFTCAIDPSGAVFYASLGFAAIDPTSGETLWTLADGFAGSAPNTLYYAGPVVLAGDRRLVLMDHDGGVHILGD